MPKNSIRETLLSQYMPTTPKLRIDALYRSSVSKTKATSLEEFYREVHAKHEQNNEHPYQNKNAKEIETIMMQNRKLIDHKRSGCKRGNQ